MESGNKFDDAEKLASDIAYFLMPNDQDQNENVALINTTYKPLSQFADMKNCQYFLSDDKKYLYCAVNEKLVWCKSITPSEAETYK